MTMCCCHQQLPLVMFISIYCNCFHISFDLSIKQGVGAEDASLHQILSCSLGAEHLKRLFDSLTFAMESWILPHGRALSLSQIFKIKTKISTTFLRLRRFALHGCVPGHTERPVARTAQGPAATQQGRQGSPLFT